MNAAQSKTSTQTAESALYILRKQFTQGRIPRTNPSLSSFYRPNLRLHDHGRVETWALWLLCLLSFLWLLVP
jgi:hypothetical protein